MTPIKLDGRHRGIGVYTHKIKVVNGYYQQTHEGQKRFWTVVKWFENTLGRSHHWRIVGLHAPVLEPKQLMPNWCYHEESCEILLRDQALTTYCLASDYVNMLAEQSRNVNHNYWLTGVDE